MKKAKLFSVLAAIVLLIACVTCVLGFGTSAADEAVQWTVDGTTYASVKAALTAAEKETWAATQSLVITVDPAKVASESISHDAGGTAYEGGIAFGQKTIFRADGTRLPITIKGSSDRTAFTLNITAGTKVACANSYTFKDLTFPIGDAGEKDTVSNDGNSKNEAYFYAGSGIVRLENVATSAGSDTHGWLAGDNFTARAFDGWTAANVAANSDAKGRILTSMGVGSGTRYVSKIAGSGLALLRSHTVAVADSDGWDAFSGVIVAPSDTSAQFLVDGGTIGYLRGRIGTNPVGESIERIDSGTVSNIYGLGTHSTKTTYSKGISYSGDHTVIVNGGTIEENSRILFCAHLDGNYTINITGGTFKSYIQPGWNSSTISGNFEMNVSGGNFNDVDNCFYAHPSAVVSGTCVTNVSGGTFKGPFQGMHASVADDDGNYIVHNPHVINIRANAESSSKNPVFEGAFYAARGATPGVSALTVNIYAGTFNTYTLSNNVNIGTAVTNIYGGTFNGIFYGGDSTGKETCVIGSITNNIYGGTFNKEIRGVVGNANVQIPTVNLNITDGTFASYVYATYKAPVKNMTVKISGGTFKGFVTNTHTAGVETISNTISGGTFDACVYPGKVTYAGAIGSIKNKVAGGTFNANFFASGQYGNISPYPTVVNEISGGTFNAVFYGGGEMQKCYAASITNKVSGGIFKSYFYGGSKASNLTSTTIVNEISGGTFEKSFLGGNVAGAVKSVTNKISGGTFDGNFYGGSDGGTITSATTEVTKGTFNGIYYGGNYSKATINITNNIRGGTFNNLVMGAGKAATTGNVSNTISGGTFNSLFMGAGVLSAVDGNVTNNISGGTFAKPVFGGACNAAITGTITNNLCGPVTFTQGFCAVHGTQANGGSTGNIVNRIYADANGKAPKILNPPANEAAGSVFTYNSVKYDVADTNGFSFLGGTCYGTITGTITNTVEAGEFGSANIGMFHAGSRNSAIGKDANGVSIFNTIKGGTFNFRFYGGCLSGTASGEIRTVIEGGVFKKEFTAGNRSMSSYNKPITLVIRGGEFLSRVYGTYFGYTDDQSARGQISSTVTVNIEGGIFRDDIYGMGNRGFATTNYPNGSGITADGAVLVNIYGGTFYGAISPTNESPVEANILGTARVTVEPKCGDVVLGKKMIPRIAAEKFLLKGGEYKILLDAKGKIEATSAEGEINFEQVDKWMNATYLTLPAGHNATVNVTTAKGAYGYFETVLGDKGEVIEVCGAALKMGASMILTDRIALKFQLSKEAVDAVENFTYSFTLPDGTVLAEGTKADLKEMMEITEFEYYTLISKSLGIGQFDTPITVNIKGLWENDTFSVSTLATAAVTAWEGNDNFVLMAKAIVNMAKAAKGEAVPYTLTPDEVVYDRKTPTRDEAALVSFTGKSLLMSSAVGIRLSGTVGNAADVEGLVVKVNGNNVTDRALIRVDGTKLTVDLYFTAYGMSKEFRLEILDKNGKNCLTMYERLDSFATQYGREHALAYALLSYVQSTSAMTKASFNLTASEAEIEYLNSLYAGETAYYGDLHGHPGGGIIEDGKVDMSIWVADRTTIGVDFYTAMNHKQVAHMYDDGWDDSVLIGGSEPATTVTKDGAKISVHYNMIVPNPEVLIEVLGLFPEFGYTGGTDDIALNMGTFGYPKFTYERFNELISAIKERGGTVVNVHPKQQHTSDNPLDYYYQDYMGLEVFYSYDDKNIHGKDSKANYDLWCDLLALGKRVWATAGSDSHGAPVNTGLTTLYASEALNTKYVEKLAVGNFAPGYAGIRMAIGDTEMGGHTDFAGKKLIFSVGDIHELYLSETRAYTVNVITDQGVVYSTVIDGTKTNYFSLDADENAAFYRIEVVDEELQGLPIVGLGNPIWND